EDLARAGVLHHTGHEPVFVKGNLGVQAPNLRSQVAGRRLCPLGLDDSEALVGLLARQAVGAGHDLEAVAARVERAALDPAGEAEAVLPRGVLVREAADLLVEGAVADLPVLRPLGPAALAGAVALVRSLHGERACGRRVVRVADRRAALAGADARSAALP